MTRAAGSAALVLAALVGRADALVRPEMLAQAQRRGGELRAPALGASPAARLAASSAVLLRGGAARAAKRPATPPHMSLVARTWGGYLELLEAYPMRTKMATSAVLSAVGDVLAQTLDKSVAAFSLRRLLVLVSVNIFYFSPALHYWYNFFDVAVGKLKLRPGTWGSALAYLALDQLVNTPLTLLGFFHVFALANAASHAALGAPMPGAGVLLAGVRAKMGVEYANALLANWKVWALPQLVNFMFVPPSLRVGFANLVAIVWNAILSMIANR
ncbi:hypothetical protein KFE25_008154 [Diacronema lutheri]|uniref:Peroxisomal membrane protein MPV17 n=2 Tax=Diacronema lutheri TaxID=2081491 RepID=A0A8J6CEC6_DIALT|nr:hypothetical protein KFE25_008154 [Diacronema lutheri]